MFTGQQFKFDVLCFRQYVAVQFVLCYTLENDQAQ